VYGYAPDAPAQVVTFRVTAYARTTTPQVVGRERFGEAAATTTCRRRAYFEERGGFVACPVYDRARLARHAPIDGPARLDQMDTPTIVLPDQRAEFDEGGCLILTFKIDASWHGSILTTKSG